ncbi:unnamed protein product, partial [Meganyctiphanes norvegica]
TNIAALVILMTSVICEQSINSSTLEDLDAEEHVPLTAGCVVGHPRGEDGQEYCRRLTKEEVKIRDNLANNILVITIADEKTDGLARFIRSGDIYKYKVKVLGEGLGELSNRKQLDLLREELNAYKDDKDKLVLYTTSQSAVLSAGPSRLVEEFQRFETNVLISADGFCWPDRTLEPEYPKVERGKRYLNSEGLFGRASILQELLASDPDAKSLQVLLTAAFIKETSRKQYGIKVDHMSHVFQNLNGATGDVELRFAGREAYIQNTLYNTVPIIINGNAHTNTVLNTFSSYLAQSWNPEGCKACWENMKSLEKVDDKDLPSVTIGVFIEKETPFFEEFLMKIEGLKYPASKIDLFIHNTVEYHAELVNGWIESIKDDYASVKQIPLEDNVKEWHARNSAIDYCLEKSCDYLLVVDSEAHLNNPFVLKLLIEQNRDLVAPMLSRPYKAWSNFWGAITSDGFYARSMDYMDIVQNTRRGLWNVPYINSCYLMAKSVFENKKTRPSYINKLQEPDMAFAENLREKGVFMYVSNRVDFGHLVNAETFDTTHLHPELWEISSNRWDWEQRYLHVNYTHALNENSTLEMPCPDVYWFPIFTERFAEELIEVMENHGSWSAGSNEDARLEGGYESVPTIDIHMKQVGYEEQWLEILHLYIQPLQLRAYEGYNNEVGPPRAIMNFVVRYKPEEQPFLRPHHDTSTYTINVALNRPGIDFEGGGCRFVRYDCSVTNTRVGWTLMHPGRLTHLHEGLITTAGTRYIVVSFIDP